MGKPRIDGELSARLPIAGLWPGAPPRLAAAGGRSSRSRRDKCPAKAKPRSTSEPLLSADPAGATLTDLALSFEQDGRPQLITGELQRRLAGCPRGGDEPRLALARSRPHRRRQRGRRAPRQHRPAGHAAARPAAGRRPLARDLPGRSGQRRQRGRQRRCACRSPARTTSSRSRSCGSACPAAAAASCRASDGPRRGARVRRQHRPARERACCASSAGRKAPAPADAKGDGAFGVRAQLSIARAAPPPATSSATSRAPRSPQPPIRWEGRPELSLASKARRSTRAPFAGQASFAEVLQCHGQPGRVGLHGGQPARQARPTPARRDLRLSLDAGQLITAARTYRDVAMEIGSRAATCGCRCCGSADEGCSLELEGEVDDAASRPKGSLRAWLPPPSAAAPSPLAELLGIPEAFRPDAAAAQAMAPLRLAGSWRSEPARPPRATWCSTARPTGRPQVTARLDGAPRGWRTGPADVTGHHRRQRRRKHRRRLLSGGAAARRQARARAGAGQGRSACRARGCRRPLVEPAIWRSTSVAA